MAAQLSGEDVHLNTGKREFLLYNASDELVLQDGGDLNSQSCVDHSILAIFEDSSVCSESKNNMEEDSETLLSALAEMLDRVEDDGDETFSPFDVLPNTGLISQTLIRDEDVSQEPSPQRHRPKPKSKTGRKKENKVLPKALEATVEVFTSTSLISLVNLMHPYCLKLQVEMDKPGSGPSLFSQEEVWKYEQPTEENDEEIHVVSEDEAPAKRTEEDVKGEKSSCLKGVLLNGNPPRAVSSRDRKRVSFGPVHVASLDESEEEGLGGGSGRCTGPEPLQSTKAAENPETLHLSSLVSERNDGQINNQQDGGKRSRTRAKSLSLQEYRKLRQSRRPLVEQRGDHTTRWPSITESPRELTPILCFLGQNQNFTNPNLHQPSVHCGCPPHPPSPFSSHQSHTRFKSSRTESKIISPTSPLLDDTTTPNVAMLGAISTDPPNPVLLPVPVPRTPPNPPPQSRSGTGLQPRSRRRQGGQNAQTPGAPSEPKPRLSSPDEGLRLDDAALPQEVKATKTPPGGSSASPLQTSNCSRSSESSLRETNIDELPPNSPGQPRTGPAPPPVELKEEAQQERSSPQTDPREPRVAVASGIEAPDPTGLLEQFEETQAKEHEAPRVESGLGPASSPSHQQTDVLVEPNKPGGPERTSGSPLKCSASSSDSRTLLDVRTLEPVDVPDPVRTEVVQSSQRDEPTRRNGPPSKSVQVIEPRPLPSKRVHTGPAEAPAPRAFSHLSFDHDYCGSADLPPGSRCSQTSEPSTEQQLEAVVLLHSEQPWVGPEALQLSERAVMEGVGVDNIQFLPTPPPSPPVRGREKRRYRRRSPDSSSSSSCSSCGCSPKRQRIHRRRSGSSSCLSSPASRVSRSPPPLCSLSFSRSAYSRSRSSSRSSSRSPSQTRSPSPASRRRRWREARSSSRESRRLQREQEVRIQKLKAIDERRVVYVGRIRRTMTHNELQERFSQFGEVECVSLHFRDRGDHYAFVTFYNMKDAFAAIDNGGKLRKPDELPFDICFGGRRQFCSSNYADLDANRDAEPSPPCRSRFEDLDFDLLLKQAQRGLKR